MGSRFVLILALASAALAQGIPPHTELRVVRDPRQQLLFEFSEARGQFSDAIEELRSNFWVEKNRKKAVKTIDQKVDVFLRYLRVASTERPTFEPGDLKTLTPMQLAAEALKLSQSLRSELRQVARTENNTIVPVSHWEFLYKVESNLLRLKWMGSQLR